MTVLRDLRVNIFLSSVSFVRKENDENYSDVTFLDKNKNKV